MSAVLTEAGIRQLSPEEVAALEPVFSEEWRCEMPDPKYSRVLAEIQNGRLAGFLTVESQVAVGGLYVFPEFRGTRAHARLLDYAEDSIRPTGRSLYAMTTSERVARMIRRRGAVRVPFDLYRKDY
jgi:hypothetical protein